MLNVFLTCFWKVMHWKTNYAKILKYQKIKINFNVKKEFKFLYYIRDLLKVETCQINPIYNFPPSKIKNLLFTPP